MMKDQFSCPRCGSKNVETLCTVWYDTNKDEPNYESEVAIAELYDHFYCNDCMEHPAFLESETVEVEPPDPYPHYVTIAFGSESWRASGEGDEAQTFRFATQAELDAFMTGVTEAEGWMGFEIEEDSRDSAT